MRVGSLFSGIEGFGLGFTLAGWSVAWVSEIDAYSNRVLRVRFPESPNRGDITVADPATLDDVDCITFGFPCQDLSVAGHRAGLEGDRSGLFWEALRIVVAKRPRWIVAENVPGLQSSNQGMDFGVVLWALAAIGYSVSYAELDAQHYGVPQRRRRVFLVGCLGGEAGARAVLADAHGGYRNPPTSDGARSGVADAFDGGLDIAFTIRQNGRSAPSTGAGNVVAGTAAQGGDHFGTLRSNPRNNSNPASSPLVWGAVTARDGKGPDSDGRGIVADAARSHPRGHSAGPTDLLAGTTGGSAAHDGSRHGGDDVGPPDATHSPNESPKPDADGTGGWDEARPLDGRNAPAPTHTHGDGAPSGLPRWLDLPMWQGAEEPWRLHLDGVAVASHRREEGRKGNRNQRRGAVDGGGGAVAGQSDNNDDREREREREVARTVTTGTGTAGRGAAVIAQTRPATAAPGTPSRSPSRTGSPNESRRRMHDA